MTRTRTGSLSRKTLAATLAAALALTTAGAAPARADNNEAIAAAALLGLIVAGIIASSRDGRTGRYPPAVTSRYALPDVCRFDIRRGADRGSWYGRNCLTRNDAPVWVLPDRCARLVDVPRRHHRIIAYSASCLARVATRPAERGRDHGHRDRH